MAQYARDIVEQRYRPTVLVLSTEGAEIACKKNHLGFIDLLRPFCSLKKDVHTRTTGDPYLLSSFGIRLSAYGSLPSTSDEVRVQWFTELARSNLDFNLPAHRRRLQDWEATVSSLAEQSDPTRPDIDPEAMNNIVADLTSPLLQRFKDEYSLSCRFTSFETLDHPVGCILAVSASSADAITELKGLSSPSTEEFVNAAVDAQNLLHYYILVQDLDASLRQSSVDKVFSDMKATFGAQYCKLLKINGNRSGEQQSSPDKWRVDATIDNQTPHAEEHLPHLGRLLTLDDEATLSTLMSTYIELTLLPHLTRRVKSLNMSVSDKRQGKLGKMVSYWLGGKNDAAAASRFNREGPHFDPVSCEMQLRKLADLCFLMHDYETAHSAYKMLKSELSSQENRHLHTYQAAVHEGLGMCMAVQQRRDADGTLDQAASLYMRGSRPDFALRVRLLQYSLAKPLRGYRSAEIMKKASQIDERKTLYCGMFTEEAGMSYLYNQYGGNVVSRIRKFALNLTLAGSRYTSASCECTDQALRVTAIAAAVYRRLNLDKWRNINEHVQLTLARLWQRKNDLRSAVHHMGLYVVQGQKSTAATIREYNGYLQSYLDTTPAGQDKVYDGLPLPTIDTASIAVIPNPHSEKWHNPSPGPDEPAIPAGKELSPSAVRNEWASMETALINAVRTEYRDVTLHPQMEQQRKKKKPADADGEQPAVVQGEAVFVTMPLANPLSIPITVGHAVLLYEATEQRPTPLASINPPGGAQLKGSPVSNITIPPNSSVLLRVSFVPPSAGWMRVTGLEWSVSAEGLAVTTGNHMFYKSASEAGESGMQRVQQLTMQCYPPAPLMTVELVDAPPLYMLDGQIVKSTLRLLNVGGRPMGQVAVKLSATNVHLLCLDFPEDCKWMEDEDGPKGIFDTVFIPGEIPPGGCFEVPVWIRGESGSNGAETACNLIPMLFCYAEAGAEKVQRRVARFVTRALVLPSVAVRALSFPPSCVRPGDETDPEFIVCLEVRSLRPSHRSLAPSISLQQVSTLSCDWIATPLDPAAVAMPLPLQSAYNITFKAKLRIGGPQTVATCFAADGAADLYTPVPCDHFALNAPRDAGKKTGGAGGVDLPADGRSAGDGGMMFLDRKEKKKTGYQQQLLDAQGRRLAGAGLNVPLAFSVFWTAAPASGGQAARVEGQTLCSCLPFKTTIKPKRTWQSCETQDRNLLRERGLSENKEAPINPVPPPLPGMKTEGIVGVSVVFPTPVRHCFAPHAGCLVPVSISLTNHHNSTRVVWLTLYNTKVLYPTPREVEPVANEFAPQFPSLSNSQPLLLSTPQQPAKEEPSVIYPSFHWQGKCKHKITVGPYESSSIVAKAEFLLPGQYNVNQFDVKVVDGENVEVQGTNVSKDCVWLLTVQHDESARPAEPATTEVHEPLAAAPPSAEPPVSVSELNAAEAHEAPAALPNVPPAEPQTLDEDAEVPAGYQMPAAGGTLEDHQPPVQDPPRTADDDVPPTTPPAEHESADGLLDVQVNADETQGSTERASPEGEEQLMTEEVSLEASSRNNSPVQDEKHSEGADSAATDPAPANEDADADPN